jgi:hypothetical protein
MQDAGFDISFRDCPAKGGTGGHPSDQWRQFEAQVQHLETFSASIMRVDVTVCVCVCVWQWESGKIFRQGLLNVELLFWIDGAVTKSGKIFRQGLLNVELLLWIDGADHPSRFYHF